MEVCETCLSSERPLTVSRMSDVPMRVCVWCRAIIRRWEEFTEQCARAAEKLRHHQSDIASLQGVSCIGVSNTLCLDVLPRGEEWETRVTSGGEGGNNYCEGMFRWRGRGNKKRRREKGRKTECMEVNADDVCPSPDDACDTEPNVVPEKETRCDKMVDVGSMFVCRYHESQEEQRGALEERRGSVEYLGAPYKCDMCALPFKFQYSLDNHMKKHSPERGSVVCAICTQRFPSEEKHKKHTSVHHRQELQCLVCGVRVRERKRLKEHWEGHQGVHYTCDICKKNFKSKASLVRHLPLHSTRLPCPQCSVVLHSVGSLRRHLLLVHAPHRPHPCPLCARPFPSAHLLEIHTQRAHHTPAHYCVECDYGFKTSREYKKHLTAKKHIHPSLLIYVCSRCPRRYPTEDDLTRHVRAMHERVLCYACPECDARLATPRGLYGHRRRVHQGYVAPKKYVCSYCHKAFRDKYYLRSHMRTHTGEAVSLYTPGVRNTNLMETQTQGVN